MHHDCSFVTELALDDDQISFGDSDRETHAGDYGTREEDMVRPDVVLYPETTADVATIVSAAADRGVPITPYSAGTGLRAGATPIFGGISLDMTRMDEVIEVRPDDLQVDVQPGVIGGDLNETLASYGLFLPSLPTSGQISTIGGMISTDASGMKTVKYGEVHDWVLELEVVLADGSVIEAGSKAVKTSSGYNLKDLFVGAEGTLGIITRATMQLAGLPEQIRGGRAVFETLEDATAAVHDAVRSGVDVATIELIDGLSARMANAYVGADLPDEPMVFLEFHANHGIEEEIEFCRTVFEAHDVTRFEIAEDESETADLWEARHELAYAIGEYDPALTSVGPGDIVVPISHYPEIIRFASDLASEAGFESYWFGHAGDGNVHGGILVEEDDPDARARAREIADRVVERAVEVGGTITGEHGIGRHEKRDLLAMEHGDRTVALMRAVKRAFDPDGILNPGKGLPDPPETADPPVAE